MTRYISRMHGEGEVKIKEDVEKVFNFVTRLAKYREWHPEDITFYFDKE